MPPVSIFFAPLSCVSTDTPLSLLFLLSSTDSTDPPLCPAAFSRHGPPPSFLSLSVQHRPPYLLWPLASTGHGPPFRYMNQSQVFGHLSSFWLVSEIG